MRRRGRSPFGASVVDPLVAVLTLALAILAAPVSAQGRPITDRDLYAFRWIADPQISPDGSSAAYTLVQVNEKENRYETSILGRRDRWSWIAPAPDDRSARRRPALGA